MQKARPTALRAYQKIQAAILQQIKSGELRHGDAVPSERELARMHNVSLMTARHALSGLETAGQVQRRPGVGTFVAPPKIQFNQLSSITEQMLARGLRVRSKVLGFEVVEDEPEASAQLMVPANAKLIKVQRLRLGMEEPFAIEICYLPAERFPRLQRGDLERGSLFSIVTGPYGYDLSYADEEIDATAASARYASLLKIGRDATVLRIRQLIHTVNGTPIIYGVGFYRPDRHALYVRRYR